MSFSIEEATKQCHIYGKTYKYYLSKNEYLIEQPGLVYYSRMMIDCTDWKKLGATQNGVYHVFRYGKNKVYCNMEDEGGGWTVFQKRYNGAVEFKTRTWDDTKMVLGMLILNTG